MVGGRAARVVAAALCAALLGAPSTAAARVTVSVQIAFGSVVAGGLGLFVAIEGSWNAALAARLQPPALLEVGGGRARLELPIPSLRVAEEAAGDGHRAPRVGLDLLRWRF